MTTARALGNVDASAEKLTSTKTQKGGANVLAKKKLTFWHLLCFHMDRLVFLAIWKCLDTFLHVDTQPFASQVLLMNNRGR